MSQKPEDENNKFETWMKRLASETLKPTEETEKREQCLDKRDEYRMGEDEGEEEHYQDKGKSYNKKLGLLDREYSLTGRINEKIREEMKGIKKELEESRLEGRPFEKQEEEYNKFEEKIKGSSSKYG